MSLDKDVEGAGARLPTRPADASVKGEVERLRAWAREGRFTAERGQPDRRSPGRRPALPLRQRLRNAAVEAATMLVGLPLYALVRLIRPLVLVRLGTITADRIGHFACRINYYLAERALDIQPRAAVDIFHFRPDPTVNAQLATLARRSIRIWPWTRRVYTLFARLPGAAPHLVRIQTEHDHGDRDVEGIQHRTPPGVALSAAEQERGWRALEAFGVPRDAPLVCFHARSNAYLTALYKGTKREPSAEDNTRNADVQAFVPAMERMAARGHYAFRLGAVVETPIETARPEVIDYALRGRSAFLDVFLIANCRFLVSCCSGPDSVADLFRKPVVFTNLSYLEYVAPWLDSLTIFKRYWLRDERRLLTISEIMASGMGLQHPAPFYEHFGVELLENTAEEIAAAVEEMDRRLDGRWQPDPEDEELQERFWWLLEESQLRVHRRGRIGARFLRDNRDLLV